ncbi:MAG: winged helix DNA-binding domain-containing protein [Ferruginibacter sp.]
MSLKNIAGSRLINQQITSSASTTIKEMVAWMGAIQAQDYTMAKWAIGLRCNATTNSDVEAAINKGDIIRTHVLRPTWHFVAAADIYWMLKLTAPQIKKIMNTRFKQLEFTDALIVRSNGIIKKAVAEKHCTRATLVAALNKANIQTDENRASHLLMYAELDGIIGSGEIQNHQPTYALLTERVKPVKRISREAALEKLAKRYFASHGPATLADFVWWSGLPVKDAMNALEMIRPTLFSETIDNQTYWFYEEHSAVSRSKPGIYLLPAFDELLIGYKTREISIVERHHVHAFTKNGIFNPVIVKNAKVIGVWKRRFNKDRVIIEPAYFDTPDTATVKALEKEAKKLGGFLEKKAVISNI